MFDSGTATHPLTLYRHASGALVFGAGTVQRAGCGRFAGTGWAAAIDTQDQGTQIIFRSCSFLSGNSMFARGVGEKWRVRLYRAGGMTSTQTRRWSEASISAAPGLPSTGQNTPAAKTFRPSEGST